MTILEKIKFEEDWLSEVNLTKENIKIAFAGIRATVLEQQPSEDAVSRESVLKLAKKGILVSNDNYKCVVNAIKSLPSVTPQIEPCEDCISRQAVIQIIENKLNPCTDMFKCLEMSEIKEDVEHLPPVTPQRPKGKWIEIEDNSDEYHFECSECGQRMNWVDENDNYCCCCGAFMNPDGEG